MNDQARSRTKVPNDWSEIDSKYKDMMNKDKLKPGDSVQVINQITNEIEFGVIVYENRAWREIQIGSEFRIFSYSNHKFVKHND